MTIFCVINFSGNVGKSTTARHLIYPRLANGHLIPVETINSDLTMRPSKASSLAS